MVLHHLVLKLMNRLLQMNANHLGFVQYGHHIDFRKKLNAMTMLTSGPKMVFIERCEQL